MSFDHAARPLRNHFSSMRLEAIEMIQEKVGTAPSGTVASSIGSLSMSAGYSPAVASDAGVGPNGTGGGGGGGAKQCTSDNTNAGPGGGGGGAGGCGGAGGHAGASGGVSAAILAFQASLTLSTVTLSSATGGKGGDGGDGQAGQLGGNPGDRGSNTGDGGALACLGGQGGTGGQGGPGAGGHGGPSALILETGSTITRDGPTTNDSVGSGGAVGIGADNGGSVAAAPNGNIGPVCAKLTLPSEACVPLD